jgi:hypothetical protein
MKKALFSQHNFHMTSETDNDKFLDQILQTEIPGLLKEDFAAVVVKKAFRQIALRQSLTELLAYTGVVTAGLLSLLVIVYFFNKESWLKWTDFMMSNLTLLSGAILILLFVLLVDRLLLPMAFLRKQEKIAD